MSFLCMSRFDFKQWKKGRSYKEIDTLFWVNDLIDSGKNDKSYTYPDLFMINTPLALTNAEYLWGKESLQNFFIRLCDVREKQSLQTILVTELDGMQKELFSFHMNICYSIFKLSDSHLDIPECPVTYEGDAYEYLRLLYDWDNQFDVHLNIEVGRLLSEINPILLPDRCVYSYQRDLGDYYSSIDRHELALSTYIRGYYGVIPSNYSYLKRWDYLLAIAETYISILSNKDSQQTDKDFEAVTFILDRLIMDTESHNDFDGAEWINKVALLKKIIVLGRYGCKNDGEQLLHEKVALLTKDNSNLIYLLELMDIADVYYGTDMSEGLIIHLARESDKLQKLQLNDKKLDTWIQGENFKVSRYRANNLQDKLMHVDSILDNLYRR